MPTFLIDRNSSVACRLTSALALTFSPFMVLAQPIQGIVDAASANDSAAPASDAERDKAARLAKQKEDCDKSIDEIAYNNLGPEHRKTLGPQSFVNDLAPVSTYNTIRNAISLFSTGATDATRALRALDEGRVAAIMYKAELCSASMRDPGRSAVAEEAAASSAAAPVVADTPSATGQKVVGLDDWEGEISGRPVAGGKFEFLKIGMKATQVIGAIGRPDGLDFRSPVRSKISSPSLRYRFECAYKGIGRLVFSSTVASRLDEMYLVQIIHNPEEPGKI